MKKTKNREFISLTEWWIRYRIRKHLFIERRNVVENQFFLSNLIFIVYFCRHVCLFFQFFFHSTIIIHDFTIIVQIKFMINECVRIMCFVVFKNDKTSIFTNQWKIYNFDRDDQKKNVTQINVFIHFFLKILLIDCSTNVVFYVLL